MRFQDCCSFCGFGFLQRYFDNLIHYQTNIFIMAQETQQLSWPENSLSGNVQNIISSSNNGNTMDQQNQGNPSQRSHKNRSKKNENSPITKWNRLAIKLRRQYFNHQPSTINQLRFTLHQILRGSQNPLLNLKQQRLPLQMRTSRTSALAQHQPVAIALQRMLSRKNQWWWNLFLLLELPQQVSLFQSYLHLLFKTIKKHQRLVLMVRRIHFLFCFIPLENKFFSTNKMSVRGSLPANPQGQGSQSSGGHGKIVLFVS